MGVGPGRLAGCGENYLKQKYSLHPHPEREGPKNM